MEKKKLSVGFADLTNYHKFVMQEGTEKAVDLLQEVYQFTGDIIIRHGGKILKYIGDAVMFSFEDPKKAAAAACEIAQFKQKSGALPVQASVSVATGEVLSGKVGHPSMLVEDIFGETVNRAALLGKEAVKNEPKVAFDEETKKYL